MNILKCFPAVLAFSALSVAEASEGVSFLFKPLLAGRASLTESGFVETRALGTACFAPELKLPVELVYRSALNGGLARIATPNGTTVDFERGKDGGLLAVSSCGVRFIELDYAGGLVSAMRVNGVPVAFSYAGGKKE